MVSSASRDRNLATFNGEVAPNLNRSSLNVKVIFKCRRIGEVTLEPPEGEYYLYIEEAREGELSIRAKKVVIAKPSVQQTAEKVEEADIMRIILSVFPPKSGIETLRLEAVKERARDIEAEIKFRSKSKFFFKGKGSGSLIWINPQKTDDILLLAALNYLVLEGKIYEYRLVSNKYYLCLDEANREDYDYTENSYHQRIYNREILLEIDELKGENYIVTPTDTPILIKAAVDKIIEKLNENLFYQIDFAIRGRKSFKRTPVVVYSDNASLDDTISLERDALNYLKNKGFFESWVRSINSDNKYETTVLFFPDKIIID